MSDQIGATLNGQGGAAGHDSPREHRPQTSQLATNASGADSVADNITAPSENRATVAAKSGVEGHRLACAEQQKRLEECEAAIAKALGRGVPNFYESGMALRKIRADKLYRANEDCRTFRQYLRVRWDISPAYASMMITAAETVHKIVNAGLIAPESEGAIRPLTKLKDEQIVLVWSTAIELTPTNKRTTSKHVHQAMDELGMRPKNPKNKKSLAGPDEARRASPEAGQQGLASLPTVAAPSPDALNAEPPPSSPSLVGPARELPEEAGPAGGDATPSWSKSVDTPEQAWVLFEAAAGQVAVINHDLGYDQLRQAMIQRVTDVLEHIRNCKPGTL
jgi:hypothetical protein